MTGVFLWRVVTLLVSVYPRAKVQEKQASNFARACVPPRYGMAAYKVIDYSLFWSGGGMFREFFHGASPWHNKMGAWGWRRVLHCYKKIAICALGPFPAKQVKLQK